MFKKILPSVNKIHSFRIEILLSSLICVFFLNIFFPDNIYGGIAQSIYLPFQLLAALVLFESKRRILWPVGSMALLLLLGRTAGFFLPSELNSAFLLLNIIFFGSIMLEVFRQLSKSKFTSGKSILAAICGLLLIGYCGYYVLVAVEVHTPGSFNGLGEGLQAFNDLFYFSYITLLTIGYGDITPKTWIAKNATVLLGLTAYIYSIVVIAAIVGRASKTHDTHHDTDENTP